MGNGGGIETNHEGKRAIGPDNLLASPVTGENSGRVVFKFKRG